MLILSVKVSCENKTQSHHEQQKSDELWCYWFEMGMEVGRGRRWMQNRMRAERLRGLQFNYIKDVAA